MRHSKLPWRAVKSSLNAMEVRGKNGKVVCEIINDDGATLTTLMEDNAAFIAHAANCHEELLLCCKAVLDAWHAKDSNFQKKEPPYLQPIRAAIKNAEGVA
jgi:hypothetical protein